MSPTVETRRQFANRCPSRSRFDYCFPCKGAVLTGYCFSCKAAVAMASSRGFLTPRAGKPLTMNQKMLGIYLNDHLAGSTVGSRLARRIVRQNEGNDYGVKVAGIAREIEEDRATLRELMDNLGIDEQRARVAMAWFTEKAMRLKPNGNVFRYSPLSRVLELETLTLGISGKLELWRSLEAVQNGDRIPGFDFTQLARRAETQRDIVESLRRRAAVEALGG